MNKTFYYTKSGKVFHHRYDAILSKEECLFYFNDKEFLNCDWTKEPKKSLWELYKERAIQLRSMYDYVILCYSGGIDSTSILETFYYNDIPLDEIVTVGALSQDSYRGSTENNNHDLHFNVFPTLKKLRPKSKITVLDYTKYFDNIKQFSIVNQYGDEYYKHIGSYYSVHNIFWSEITKFLDDGSSKKTCVLFGSDKPWLEFNNGRPCFRIRDGAHQEYGAGAFYTSKFERVNFYTDLLTTELLAKQHHVLWKFYKEYIDEKKLFPHSSIHKMNTVNGLIYNLKNPLTAMTIKSKNNIESVRDGFLKKISASEDIKTLFTSMLKKMINEGFDHRKCFYSRYYYLV